MRRIVAVLVALVVLNGCSLLYPTRPPASPLGTQAEVLAVINMTAGEVIWPGTALPPGEYRVEWASDCQVALVYQGATLIRSDDPPNGARAFTIVANQTGDSLVSACYPDDTMTAVISVPDQAP